MDTVTEYTRVWPARMSGLKIKGHSPGVSYLTASGEHSRCELSHCIRRGRVDTCSALATLEEVSNI